MPTVSESGLKDDEVSTWYGVLVPAGTPAPLIDRIHADMVRVIRLPEIRDCFASEAGDIVASTPQEFGTFIAQEITKWAKVAREAGAKVD